MAGRIYLVTYKPNKQAVYVGKTENAVSTRIAQHVAAASSRQASTFEAGLTKYGASNFEYSTLEDNIPSSKLAEREKYWIAKMKPLWNETSGG